MFDVVRSRPLALLLFVLAVAEALLVDGSALSAAAVVIAAAAASVLVVGRLAPAVPPTRVRTAIRDREQRTAFLPQRDPDASGRRRPRAPGRLLPTTA